MKAFRMIYAIALLSWALACSAQAEVDYREYARLLQQYVQPAGVQYAEWAAEPTDTAALDRMLQDFAQVAVAELPRDSQKAFYLNLYNAAMLQAVLQHYPLQSVRSIGLIPFSIFKREFIAQGGRQLSLDAVEKGILLQDYFDPRIHFAVNCASVSCPPLRAEPFVAAQLEAQLEQQTRAFADSAHAAQLDAAARSVAYTELFKWYADDFPGTQPAEYLNRWRCAPLPLDYEIRWIPYDWSLNALEPAQ